MTYPGGFSSDWINEQQVRLNGIDWGKDPDDISELETLYTEEEEIEIENNFTDGLDD